MNAAPCRGDQQVMEQLQQQQQSAHAHQPVQEPREAKACQAACV